jgi:hypothetical protein
LWLRKMRDHIASSLAEWVLQSRISSIPIQNAVTTDFLPDISRIVASNNISEFPFVRFISEKQGYAWETGVP